ncbi:MAG: universal stress protein [Gemmatimonadetes bacterium]|nr:universal stress protein [Gemmatimonadota bacterium]
MQLRHLVVGADHSEEGKAAVLAAARLGQRCGANVTVVTVTAAPAANGSARREMDDLRSMVESALRPVTDAPAPRLAIVSGLPGVEIGRYAETHHADLVLVGRKRRTEMQRLLIGDTADSVARRSGIPCLFVTPGTSTFDHVLVALDGTERGMSVLVSAMDFTRDTGGRLHGVCVEPAYENERDAPHLLTTRSARLMEAVDELRHHTSLGPRRGGGEARRRSPESPRSSSTAGGWWRRSSARPSTAGPTSWWSAIAAAAPPASSRPAASRAASRMKLPARS